MSEENVEIVRRMYAAFSKGDLEGTLSHFATDVEVDTGNARPDVRLGKGREYLASVVGGWAQVWEGWTDEVEETRDLGDEVLAVSIQRGKSKGGGIELEQRYATSTASAAPRSPVFGCTGPSPTPSKPPRCRSRPRMGNGWSEIDQPQLPGPDS